MATAPATDYAPLKDGVKVDVAVLGGGIAGITAAFLLKKAGATVAVVEADRILCGVTGRTTAHISSSQGFFYRSLIDHFDAYTARKVAASNQGAIDFIERTVGENNIACDLARLPENFYASSKDDVERLKSEYEAQQIAGLPVSYEERAPLPFENYGVIKCERQGRFHPLKYLDALAKTIPGDGSFIFEKTRALDVKEGEPCRIDTDKGQLRACDVIISTHFPISNRGLLFARMVPYRSYVIGARLDNEIPDEMYYSTEEPCHYIRSEPSADGPVWLIGGEDHAVGEVIDTASRYKRLRRFIDERFKVRSIDYSWSTQDNYTADDLPYIGKIDPESRHVYVSTAFNGNGMTYGTISGLLLTDLLTGRDNPYASIYNPGRVKLSVSAGELLTRNLHVGEMFFGDRFSGGEDAARIPVGEAGISSLENRKVAAFRDDGGNLHAVSPACTHMGCYVRWNNAERTWDCPCHGSRYTYDGDVIHAPTVKDLKEEAEEKKPGQETMKAAK
jgi:glycine/D-amino acid oxidase-like deaminating enzyme/nitrite reductase/ring-hydroxylating ferredoxin subunit